MTALKNDMQPYETLEYELRSFTGSENTVVCSSGTAALHLALETLRLPKNSEVILPSYTMIACARAVVMAGLTPVFIDNDPKTLLMDTSLLSDAYTDRTMAIMPVHLHGRSVDMTSVNDFARDKGLYVIEDMAEIHGVKPTSYTHAACWSFYKNKVVHGEEGGCIAFRNDSISEQYATLSRSLRSLGINTNQSCIDANNLVCDVGKGDKHKHNPYNITQSRGHNYRMSNTHAKLILRSLHDFPQEMRNRREIERIYDRWIPKEWQMSARLSPWVYDIQVPFISAQTQYDCVYQLNRIGIAARPAFVPIHKLPEFQRCTLVSRRLSQGLETGASLSARRTIALPFTSQIKEDVVIRKIIETISNSLKEEKAMASAI